MKIPEVNVALLNEHLEHLVTQLLKSSAPVSSQRITARADDGRITLTGEVQSFREKLAAHELVKNSPHVKSVNNLLVVAPNGSTTNHQITFQVVRQLAQSPDVSGQSIHVDAHDGDVILTGYVTSDADRLVATDIAKGVDGVQQVHDWLMVNPDQVMANKELCHAIRGALERVIGLEIDDIWLSIVDESAQLVGRVDALWKKEAAEATVRRFDLLHVTNNLDVQPVRSARRSANPPD